MRHRSCHFLCVLALLLAGCATPEQERRERLGELRARSVSDTVSYKVARGERLSISDILHLVQRGVDDDTIIDYLSDTRAVYRPTEKELQRLYRGGASQALMEHIVESGGGTLQSDRPAPYYTETHVVGYAPAYPGYYSADPYFYGGHYYYSGGYYHRRGGYHGGRDRRHERDRPRYPHERISDRFRDRF